MRDGVSFKRALVRAVRRNRTTELAQSQADEHSQLVLTTDQADMGAAELAFRSSVDGFVFNYCGDVWHRIL